ncbi:nitrous oxide reductase accessory protein NosL [Geobacter pickeringii]|uniref:nitrous oxide reductase accessory protein NosL n=1 Tax=Geobacter pickeringii TaxID=345632 RepID=UPI000689C44A|nr:nitrous oxide reductase accessory protein NosL [Geobacter pickeringii]
MIKLVFGVMLSLLVAGAPAFAVEKVEAPKSCQVCGMSRTSSAHSRVLIVYADGSTFGTCSLHCLAAVMNEPHGRQIASVKVADFRTGRLIDARTAVWVIGSREKGSMAGVAQLAFSNGQEAQAFIKKNGGMVAAYEQALKLAGMEKSTEEKE